MASRQLDVRALLAFAAVACTTACTTPKPAASDANEDAAVATADAAANAGGAPSARLTADEEAAELGRASQRRSEELRKQMADQEAMSLALAGGGGGCSVTDDSRWWLRLDLRAPRDTHRRALVARSKSLPGTLHCGSKGETYLELTTKAARGIFAEHASKP